MFTYVRWYAMYVEEWVIGKNSLNNVYIIMSEYSYADTDFIYTISVHDIQDFQHETNDTSPRSPTN